ncbi:MAG: hypothetical protein RL648_1775 [Verrucomicrobiota bacterium]
MQRFYLIFMGAGLCLGAGWAWQFHQTSRQAADHKAARNNWAIQSTELETRLSQAAAELETAATRYRALELEARGNLDRATNLTAQRDHLKRQVDQLLAEEATHREHVIKWETELEGLRLETIRLAGEPARLQAELQSLRRQTTDLEDALDAMAKASAHLPPSMEVAGISSDKQVFSLAGDVPDGLQLPQALLLCNGGTVILEGWLNRIENGIALGHVKDWRRDASELVNGTKVFIVSHK